MKTGVLLINTGTPDSPAVGDVRRYLSQFLNDPRVIDLPYLKRKLLVNAIIVPFRAPRVAKLYKSIWTDKGSPLLVNANNVEAQLQREMGEGYFVRHVMRYGNPSVESGIRYLLSQNVSSIVVVPMYPQYASASTGSALEEVMRITKDIQGIPAVRMISSYHDHPAFIKAWAELYKESFGKRAFDHVLFTFHGLPERQIRKTNGNVCCLKSESCCDSMRAENALCYRAQCYDTARKIAGLVNLPPAKYSVSFQSRLGRDPWIKPYTDEVIRAMPARGIKSLLVLAPSFVADCLETVEEIGTEYRKLFLSSGGKEFERLDCLNSHPAWIAALRQLVVQS